MKTPRFNLARLIAMALLLAVVPLGKLTAQTTVPQYLQQGRAQLALQTSKGLENAHSAFASALTLDPNNPVAIILETSTHLALLIQQPEFATLLSQSGVTQTNQNAYTFDLQLPVDGNGRALAAANAQTSTILNYATTVLRPVLLDALAKLQRIPAPLDPNSLSNYLNLTQGETSSGYTSIDYADVQWFSALLHLLLVPVYGKDTLNLQIALQDYLDLSDGYIAMQDVLAKYPSFAASSPSGNARTEAKKHLTSGLNAFGTAYTLALKAHRSQPNGYNHLFTLDLSSPGAISSASISLAQIKALTASVGRPTKIPANRSAPDPLLDNQTLCLGAVFKPAFSPRGWVGPNSFYGDKLIRGSLKDPSLSGIFKSSNLAALMTILQGTDHLITPYSQTISFTAPPSSTPYSRNGTITLSATGGASGRPVVFTSRSKNISISGNTVTLLGTGPVVITATQAGYVPSWQVGPGPYAEATPVTRSMVITKGTPQITLSVPSSVAYSNGLSVSVTASNTGEKRTILISSNPNVGSFQRNGNLLIKAPGTVVIKALVPASRNFTAASTSKTLTVTP
jgi:hypothetical protein